MARQSRFAAARSVYRNFDAAPSVDGFAPPCFMDQVMLASRRTVGYGKVVRRMSYSLFLTFSPKSEEPARLPHFVTVHVALPSSTC
jgi:hypothetical protein